MSDYSRWLMRTDTQSVIDAISSEYERSEGKDQEAYQEFMRKVEERREELDSIGVAHIVHRVLGQRGIDALHEYMADDLEPHHGDLYQDPRL